MKHKLFLLYHSCLVQAFPAVASVPPVPHRDSIAMPTVAPSWEKDVWSIVGKIHKRLEANTPTGFRSLDEYTAHTKQISTELGKTGEARGEIFNLAWLNPMSHEHTQ